MDDSEIEGGTGEEFVIQYVTEDMTGHNEGTAHFSTGWFISQSLGGDKVSMLTHTYPHKPRRKTEVTICNHQADSPLCVWPDVWSGDLQV